MKKKKKKTKFTPEDKGGSGRLASATESTQHFGRLNIKTDISVQSQLIKLETSGRPYNNDNNTMIFIQGIHKPYKGLPWARCQ